MSENMFCDGNKITTKAYKDGWYRSFKGYPKMSKEMWDTIRVFSPQKLLLFFIEYVTDDQEYANFLTREVLSGEWNG